MLNADDADLLPSFTIKTTKQDDGTFKAWTPNAPDAGTAVGRTAGEAAHYLSDRLSAYTRNNRRSQPEPR